LIANDPFKGVSYDQALVSVPGNPGIGIIRRTGTG